jgi:hypothetical protein
MPAFQRDLNEDAPQLVPDVSQPARKGRGGKRMKMEPSADPQDLYSPFSDPATAMGFQTGAHDAGGQPGVGIAIAN